MKNYINEFGKEVALDGEWEMDYSATERRIKELKFSFARKNSKKSCKIFFRADIKAPQPIFWKYYIQCWIDGKLKDNSRIKEEVYNTFSKNKKKEMLSSGLESFLYFEYIPIVNKSKILSKIKKELPKKEVCKSNYLLDILFSDEKEIIYEDNSFKNEISEAEIKPEQLLINIIY